MKCLAVVVRIQNQHILTADEILSGQDLLGVLLYGHEKNAYWYGSELSIEEARNLAPILRPLDAGDVCGSGRDDLGIENPNEGIVETDEVDFERCLEIRARLTSAPCADIIQTGIRTRPSMACSAARPTRKTRGSSLFWFRRWWRSAKRKTGIHFCWRCASRRHRRRKMPCSGGQ